MAKSRSTPSAPLFESAQLADDATRPLADRLRPKSLGEVIGQDHLLGEGGALYRIAQGEAPRSMIFWGPPGTGKTTVARLMARGAGLHFEQLSAIFSGVQDLRKVFEEARDRRRFGQGTILFVDEIHRFNRSQQDSFLPYVEDGTIILIGATTENPSFELNGALLSRTKVLVFRRLDDAGLGLLLERAENVTGRKLPLTADARQALLGMADGDGRTVLNLAEVCMPAFGKAIRPWMRRSLWRWCSAGLLFTTRTATGITTSLARCISPSAAPIPMQHFTGSAA